MGWWRPLAFLLGTCAAHTVTLGNVKPPVPHSLATCARFFVYGADHETEAHHYGWWDDRTGIHPRLMAQNIRYVPKHPDSLMHLHNRVDPSFNVQLAVMDYDTFWKQFVPFQEHSHFCCTQSDVAEGTCDSERQLFLPESIRNLVTVRSVPVGLASATGLMADAPLRTSGIHYVMLANCGAPLPEGHFQGTLVARSTHGYLSAMDWPKLRLYAWGSIVYGLMSVVWVGYTLKYRTQLLTLHHLIGIVIYASFAEQLLWYYEMSYENAFFPSSAVLLTLAVLVSTFRNVIACDLVLVACLGLCITRPYLETTTKFKIVLGSICLFVLDLTRQLSTHFHASLDLSIRVVILCALPITLIYTAGFIWSFQSLSNLLDELKNRKQTAKLRQMSQYKAVLILAAVSFAGFIAAETVALSMDPRQVWQHEWFFTDFAPNLLVWAILTVVAIIWRPTRSSKYYSYNLQLPDSETGDGNFEIDRIRSDVYGKTLEVDFSGQRTGTEVKAWGDLELVLDDSMEEPHRINV